MSTTFKRIPYGIADFRQVRRENMYLVDKSMFFEEMENAGHFLFLVRPRRFCKAYFENYPLWICRFAHPSDDIDWTIWQYSHWSEVDGISGETDLNVFCSKQDDFNQWLGSYTF